jgi:serine/threonine protein kinase
VDCKPSIAPELFPGEMVDGRRLVRLLSKGGMSGEVWQACDLKIDGTKRCVLKFFKPKNDDPNFQSRCMREAGITALLRGHDNIISVYDSGEYKGMPYLVMEHLDGKPLSKIIPDSPMSIGRAMELMWPVLKGMEFAHREGIVHRDLKPDNIFETKEGQVKIIDFGVAKVMARFESYAQADVPFP